MKKNTVETVVTAALVIILLFAVASLFERQKNAVGKTKITKPKISAQQNQKANITPAAPNLKDLEARSKALTWGADPFTYRPAHPNGAVGDLKLDGVVWDKQSPKAIVSGMIVGVGEKVGEYTIVGITPDSVILSDGIKEIELKL